MWWRMDRHWLGQQVMSLSIRYGTREKLEIVEGQAVCNVSLAVLPSGSCIFLESAMLREDL
jgi:hypothetical protein